MANKIKIKLCSNSEKPMGSQKTSNTLDNGKFYAL